jgi:hypothetical protein
MRMKSVCQTTRFSSNKLSYSCWRAKEEEGSGLRYSERVKAEKGRKGKKGGKGGRKEAKRLHKAQDDTIEEYLGRLTFEDNDDSS